MCQCTPNKRTPWCGAPGCEFPPKVIVAYPDVGVKTSELVRQQALEQSQIAQMWGIHPDVYAAFFPEAVGAAPSLCQACGAYWKCEHQ